jgi:hypothetical protein
VSWLHLYLLTRLGDDSLDAAVLMLFQAILWVVTLMALGVVAIFWGRHSHSTKTAEANHDR